MRRTAKTLLLLVIVLLMTLFTTGISVAATGVACTVTGTETVATDKPDYQPEETVNISGSGYAADCDVVVRVTRPDGSVVTGDGSFTDGSDTVVTGSDGSLAYDYILDGIEGEYLVEVTGADDFLLAVTTFSDAITWTTYIDNTGALSSRRLLFERGDTVFGRADLTPTDTSNNYKISVLDPGAATQAGYPTACTAGSGTPLIDSFNVTQAMSLSTAAATWNYRLLRFGTIGCVSSTSVNANFRVLQAYPFLTAAARNACVSDLSCGSPTPRLQVYAGTPVELRVRGFNVRSDIRMQWIRPDASVACTLGPLANSSPTGFLDTTYPTGVCPATTTAASNLGLWTLRLSIEGTVSDPFPSRFTTILDAFEVIAPETPTVTTEMHLGLNSDTPPHAVIADLGHIPLGSRMHDKATVSAPVSIPNGSSVTFRLFTNHDCTGAFGSSGPHAISGASPQSVESGNTGFLTAGDYGIKALFTSGNTNVVASGQSGCEKFIVDKKNTTTTTVIHDATHSADLKNKYVYSGTALHDHATVGTKEDSISMAKTGGMQYTFFNNAGCTGTGADAGAKNVNDNGVADASSTVTPVDPGQYCFNATYAGNDNYNGSTSDDEPITVVPTNAVTSSFPCTFDIDTDRAGKQFRLIYTPEQAANFSKLNASNPGQFFYNVFYIGSGGVTLTLTIPKPFVTQGATPVHIYGAVVPTTTGTAPNQTTCFAPANELASENDRIALADYAGSTKQITVDVPASLPNGFAYITVHLDYGYKQYANTCTKQEVDIDPSPATVLRTHANCKDPNGVALNILDDTAYQFSAAGTGLPVPTNYTVRNENVFKKDPGIGGLVLDDGIHPVAGVAVDIYNSSGNKIATVYTDADGWYMWTYKYSGKATTFTVKLPAYGLQQAVTMKSNGYLVVNFVV